MNTGKPQFLAATPLRSLVARSRIHDSRWSTTSSHTISRPTPAKPKNVIAGHPEVVATLGAAYDQWCADVQPMLVNESGTRAALSPFSAQKQIPISWERIPPCLKYRARYGGHAKALLPQVREMARGASKDRQDFFNKGIAEIEASTNAPTLINLKDFIAAHASANGDTSNNIEKGTQ
jgi:hypothetical protein